VTDWSPLGEERLREVLRPLSLSVREGPFWDDQADVPPMELLAERDRLKVTLARYARQSLTGWDHVRTSQMRRWSAYLLELLEKEKEYAQLRLDD
jgi:hypothetical protein